MAIKEKEIISIDNPALQKKYKKSFIVTLVFAIIDLIIAIPLAVFGASFLPYDVANIANGITLGFYDVFKVVFMDIFSFLIPVLLVLHNIFVKKSIRNAKASDKTLINSKKMNYISIFLMFPMTFVYWLIFVVVGIFA